MHLLLDKKERPLLFSAFCSFLLLCVVEIRFPLITSLESTYLGEILIAEGTKNVVSGLLIGLLSAYIFYIIVDYIPRSRNERRTLEVLNALLASILDSYNRCRLFGHETALPYVDKSVLEAKWLNQYSTIFKNGRSKYLALLMATNTADSRIEDFRHALPLAVNLSPEHAMQWLVIIDKVRLLAENYGENPPVPIEMQQLVDKDVDENPVKSYRSTLNFRMLELVQESQRWLYSVGN
ncbi:hypothetical protein ACP3V5_17950 [Vibrio maritimus]